MAPIPLLPSESPIPTIRNILSPITSLAKRIPATSSSSPASISARFVRLLKRQSNVDIIPTTYGSIDSGPSPGVVVGIVLGSVGGFLLVLWLIYTCMNFGTISSASSYTESVVVTERRKSHHGSTRSRRASETVEVRRERSPVRVREPERVERIIVEERRETRRERSRGGSDEVVVIEEHSPPRRTKSKREKAERESGYRTVDSLAFGGVVGGRRERRGSGR